MGDQLKKKSKDFSDFLLKFIQGVLKILKLLIGVYFLLLSSLVLLGLFIGTVIGSVFSALIPAELVQFGLSLNIPIIVLGLFVLMIVGIPFVFLFTLGLHLLSRNKSMMNKTSRLVLLGLWLLSLITLLIFGVLESKSFAISAKQNSLEILEEKSADTLKVYLNKEHKYKETVTVFNHFTLIEDDAENRYRLDENIRLNIKESKGDKIELSLDKNARGWRQKEALENAKSIEYGFDYYDHQLVIDGYWLSPIESKNNPESVRLNLLLPQGQYIYLDQDLGRYLSNQIENDQDYYRKRIAGHLWKMENGSLVCQDCTALEGTVKFDEEEFKINLSDEDTSLEVNIDENGVKIQKKENN